MKKHIRRCAVNEVVPRNKPRRPCFFERGLGLEGLLMHAQGLCIGHTHQDN